MATRNVRLDVRGLHGSVGAHRACVRSLSSVDPEVPLQFRALGEYFATHSTHEVSADPGGWRRVGWNKAV